MNQPGATSDENRASYVQMKADLLALAKENGVTLETALRTLPTVQEQGTSDAKNNQGMTWDAAVQSGNKSYAEALYGISEIFGTELPKE